jgi:hypothetical protein
VDRRSGLRFMVHGGPGSIPFRGSNLSRWLRSNDHDERGEALAHWRMVDRALQFISTHREQVPSKRATWGTRLGGHRGPGGVGEVAQ